MIQKTTILKSSSHWYDGVTGEPRYEIQCKGDPTKTRTPDIRDAKREGYVASVTSIIKLLAAPGLEKYRFKELFKAMMASPKRPNETIDDYYFRVCGLAADDAALAADVGTRLHNAIDIYERGEYLEPVEDDIKPLFESYIDWRAKNIKEVIKAEGYIPTKYGYGGRFDMLIQNVVQILIDFKTKRTKPDEKIFRAPEWGYQLSGYAQALELPQDAKLWIVCISTTEAGRIEVVDFTDSRESDTFVFNSLCEIWFITKGYDPRKSPNGQERKVV